MFQFAGKRKRPFLKLIPWNRVQIRHHWLRRVSNRRDKIRLAKSSTLNRAGLPPMPLPFPDCRSGEATLLTSATFISLTSKPRTESSRNCLICATFARQRLADYFQVDHVPCDCGTNPSTSAWKGPGLARLVSQNRLTESESSLPMTPACPGCPDLYISLFGTSI